MLHKKEGVVVDVNNRLNAILKKKGWSKYRLAKECDLHESTLTNIFYRDTTPTLATLETICKALNISLPDFFADGELVEVDNEIKQFLLDFKSLSKEKQKHIIDTVKFMK